MWAELENTYNLQSITTQENEIKEKQKELQSLYEETKGQANIKRAQDKMLDYKEEFHAKKNQQASCLNQDLKNAKRGFKEKKNKQRDILAEIKSKHEQIMDMEEKTRKLTLLIKDKKEKGLSPRSSKLSNNRD